MKLKILCFVILSLACLGAMSFSGSSQAQTRRQQKGQVCPDPTVKCRTTVPFEPHDLPFRVNEKAVIWESEFFYAIILKSMTAPMDDCDKFVPESERLEAQALFPRQKVFASRCTMAGALYYTNVDDKYRFMAVYAGATQADANRMLQTVKATGKFPGANIRRMQTGFNGT